ncbi:MAG: hypothetical protein IJ849_04850 [Selenomonadaceae bacterium]|nr:hypothetical protein [Selenomonadaceae bacterium]
MRSCPGIGEHTRANFLLRGAKECRYNARHWLRYLRKAFQNGRPLLSKGEIDVLAGSEELSMFQRISLRQAMTVGTPTHEFVVALDRPAT